MRWTTWWTHFGRAATTHRAGRWSLTKTSCEVPSPGGPEYPDDHVNVLAGPRLPMAGRNIGVAAATFATRGAADPTGGRPGARRVPQPPPRTTDGS